jgi:hypothetical protein
MALYPSRSTPRILISMMGSWELSWLQFKENMNPRRIVLKIHTRVHILTIPHCQGAITDLYHHPTKNSGSRTVGRQKAQWNMQNARVKQSGIFPVLNVYDPRFFSKSCDVTMSLTHAELPDKKNKSGDCYMTSGLKVGCALACDKPLLCKTSATHLTCTFT